MNKKVLMLNAVNYWLVVRDVQTGDILNASIRGGAGDWRFYAVKFEQTYLKYQVLDIGSGERPKEVARLKYIPEQRVK